MKTSPPGLRRLLNVRANLSKNRVLKFETSPSHGAAPRDLSASLFTVPFNSYISSILFSRSVPVHYDPQFDPSCLRDILRIEIVFADGVASHVSSQQPLTRSALTRVFPALTIAPRPLLRAQSARSFGLRLSNIHIVPFVQWSKTALNEKTGEMEFPLSPSMG